jgi:RNA polymerase sigma factor (sigma-70 family)
MAITPCRREPFGAGTAPALLRPRLRLLRRSACAYAAADRLGVLVERSDESLLDACRRGDEAAWEALVARYQRLVYGIPRRAGLDADSASDVFQTVFVRLVAALETIEQPDRLRAWLVTTAKRETFRVIRKNRAQPALLDDIAETGGATPEPVDEGLPADKAFEEVETRDEVRRALDSIDERCRELLGLLFFSAEPPQYAEIASRLGMPEGSIGPTRARCLRKLLLQLENAR